jgi:uncharacterized membrane protein YecN with MAPEG domain
MVNVSNDALPQGLVAGASNNSRRGFAGRIRPAQNAVRQAQKAPRGLVAADKPTGRAPCAGGDVVLSVAFGCMPHLPFAPPVQGGFVQHFSVSEPSTMTFTPALAAASLYAGLNMLILLALAFATIRHRRALTIAIGDGGHAPLARAIRGHGNASETMPVTLLMLTLIALAGAPAAAVHVLGLTFTVARAMHGWHFTHDDAPMWQRYWGMLLTLIVQAVAAIGLVAHGLGAL